jgi:hypothetical protein
LDRTFRLEASSQAIRLSGNGTKSSRKGQTAMRNCCVVLVTAFFLGGLAWAQSGSVATTDRATMVDFAKRAVAQALDYNQGDRKSLMDAQDDFTPEGWHEFMKWLDGFVDDKGAPTGSSLFIATGEPAPKSQENGAIRLAIPGTLKQQSKNAHGGLFTTTYRVMVDVELGRNPLKIQHLKTRTCGAKPCDE